ncbi:response regulator [Microcoleus sp. D2_18a_D3]|uniref:response regulator n=1 Tax=Microcoleus sp. D2_18a_D3 TaxID=3055330 RepID=UPI002FD4DC63
MKTILIVENDLGLPPILSRKLTQREGIAVKHTDNVEEVMQIAANGEADLILIDVSLLDRVYQGNYVGGIEIIRLLKADPQTASLPIIVVAPGWVGDKERLLAQSGADGYLSKPLNYQEVVNQIKALLPD